MFSVRSPRPPVTPILLLLMAFAGPHLAAQTFFRFPGSTPVGTAAASSLVTLTVIHPGTASSIQVLTTGVSGLDFTAAAGGTCTAGSTYALAATCTVNVALTPLYPGELRGAVVLRAADGTTLALSLLSALATGPLAVLNPGAIHTVAGDAAWIFSGDGGPAVQTSIFLPFGIAVDAAGNLFITDSANNRIRRVDAAYATMSTFAGTGNIGSTGDGGPATSASLSNPSCVALDGAGNLFFSDSGNNAIRRVDAGTGIITTIAGTLGHHGYTGDNGLATLATLNTPNGLAFDLAGNLYIADTGNNAVRKLTAATGLLSTVAGNGSPSFGGDGGPALAALLNAPWSVTVSPAGELYIADQGNNRVRKIDTANHISTVIGNGTQGFAGDGSAATAALLNVPASVVLDVAGNIFVADAGNNRVRKVSKATGLIDTVAGNDAESFSGDGFSANLASLYGPYTLAIDRIGNLDIADVFHNRIRQISSQYASMLYPVIRVGRVTPPQFVSLENDGNAPLTVGAVAPIRNAAVDPATTTCANALILVSGNDCTIGAQFAPTITGVYVVGSIDVPSDAANSPGAIFLAAKVLNVDPTQITLASSLNPATVGDTVTFSVAITSPGTTPTGVVTFLDGTTTLGTATLSPNGTANFPISNLLGGQHSITASYAGDSSNAAVLSGALIQTIHDVQAATSTTLSSAANPVDAGAVLHLIVNVAVVHAGAGNGGIAGTVTFSEAGSPLGSAVINNGTGSFSISTLAVGTHTILASYGGSSTFLGSASAPLIQNVRLATVSALLTSAVNPVVGSAGVTLIATLSGTGGVPGGSVHFLEGTTILGFEPLVHGIATLRLAGTALPVGSHSLFVTYAGDAADSPAQSQPMVQVVQLATTSTALTSSINPAGLGANVRLTATVTGTGGLPTGSVQFFDGTAVIGSGQLDATGTASMSTAALTLGSHAIYATYMGDSFDAGSTSVLLLQIVNPATTAATLAVNANPTIFGDPAIFNVAVRGTGSIPSGTVTLQDATSGSNQAGGSVILDANGNGSFSFSNLSIGAHSIVAVYAGDVHHNAVNSPALLERVIQTSTTALSSSTGQANGGITIKWTAVVLGSSHQPVTGPVNFLDGSVVLGQGTPDSNGAATFSYSSLSIGAHTITAAFTGDAISQASLSNPVGESITLSQTATTLSSSTNPSFAGVPLTLTVAVSGNGGIPTGNVTFFDGPASLGVLPLSAAGTALLVTSTLAPGIHTLTANYSGDPLDAPSLSAPVSQQIVERTTVTLTTNANPSLLLDNLNVTVIVANGVTLPPSGLLTLADGSVVVGSVSLNGNGTAAFTLIAPALGSHTLTATYPGDSQNLPGSANLVQEVTLRPDRNSLTLSADNIAAGQTVTMVAVILGTGPHPPTGTVTFRSGSVILGVAPINIDGVAAVTATPQMGSYNLVAYYASDGLYASSASAPVALIVGPTKQFTFSMDPTSLSMKSGDHKTINIAVTTAINFSDTLALGCAGLPIYATCTFSANQVEIGKGATAAFTVVLDTGNPLGGGATAQLRPGPGQSSHGGSSLLACMIPGALLLLLTGRSHRKLLGRLANRNCLASLFLLLTLGTVTLVSGCASNFTEKATPAGSYTFRVTGTGNTSGANQSGVVTLTVTP